MYSFIGMLQLPEPVLRAMHDEVWDKCIHCGSKNLDRHAFSPFDAAARDGVHTSRTGRDEYHIICKDCSRRLEYLEDRWYGQTAKQLQNIGRQEEARLLGKAVWKVTPLWAICDEI